MNTEQRIDPEFFRQQYLNEDDALSRHSLALIGDFAVVTDGPHGYHVIDEASPIRMLTAKSAKEWFADADDADRIAKHIDDQNKRSSLRENDIILSTRGTVGLCALVPIETLPANLDQDVARISWEDQNAWRPGYVVAYLNCIFGQDHIARNASGMVQQGISLEKVRRIPIPRLGAEFQETAAKTALVALNERRLSKQLLADAEQTLLHTLGLENWKPPEPLTYTRRASDVFAAGRFDAEMLQPRYLAMLEQVRRHAKRCRPVQEFAVHCDRGEQPEYYDDGHLSVITSKHILETGLDYKGFDHTRAEYWDNPVFASARIRGNDILTYTTGAKVGRTACYLADERALASNHVNLLRVEGENPLYVAAVMNSMIGRWQTRMLVSGSAQVELYPADIRRFVIPFVDEKTQTAIANSVRQSHTARRRAHALLERAKRAVEVAIEQSESAALKLLSEPVEGQ